LTSLLICPASTCSKAGWRFTVLVAGVWQVILSFGVMRCRAFQEMLLSTARGEKIIREVKMLIRNLDGSVFHIVCDETKDKRSFICLCGRKVSKDDLQVQRLADGIYTRCHICRKIQNARITESRVNAYRKELDRRQQLAQLEGKMSQDNTNLKGEMGDAP